MHKIFATTSFYTVLVSEMFSKHSIHEIKSKPIMLVVKENIDTDAESLSVQLMIYQHLLGCYHLL